MSELRVTKYDYEKAIKKLGNSSAKQVVETYVKQLETLILMQAGKLLQGIDNG